MSDIKYSFYSSSKGFKVVGGTAAQFLKADGSVDINDYATYNLGKSLTRIGVGNNFERVHNKVYNGSFAVTQTGILSFSVTPPASTATMFDVTIKMYCYANGTFAELRISFYKTLSAGIHATAGKAGQIWCSENFMTDVVNVGFDPEGKMVINIGEPTTIWGNYPSYEIERIDTKYTGGALDWASGWASSVITDTTGFTLVNIPLQRLASREWAATQLASNYITSNSAQSGLTGNKTTSGNLTLNGAAANSLTILRPDNTINNSIAMGFNTASHYIGLADSNTFAIGNNPNLALPNRYFWIDSPTFSANLQGQVGGSSLTARDRGGFSISTTTNTSRAEMILRHNWSANNQTFGIGGTSSSTVASMASWGLHKWLNNRTVNGNDGFFGWEGDTDVLKATALGGIGTRMVVATASGVLQTQAIPAVQNLSTNTTNAGTINISGGGTSATLQTILPISRPDAFVRSLRMEMAPYFTSAGSANYPTNFGMGMRVERFSSAADQRGFDIFSGGLASQIYFKTFSGSNNESNWEMFASREWANGQFLSNSDLLNYYTKSESLNQFVGKNGVETIADTKTFTHSPVIPNATLNSHSVNLGQLNSKLSDYIPNVLIGIPNGVPSLSAAGIVPAHQLPSSFEITLSEFTGNFGEKLMQAINSANNGDTINALNTPFDAPDSYTINSSINITKPINIKFPAGIINFLGSGNIFNINASNVRFYGTGRSSREDLRIVTTNITYPNGNGGYHFYARGQNVITVSNMDITGVRTTNYDAQQDSATKPIDGSGGIYIEKSNPGTTGGGNTISNIILENLLIHGTRAHAIYLDTPILGSIKDVRISQGGGHGIFINGGTSMRIENCYVSSTHKTAYALYAHSYSVMNACAAEFSGNGYWLRGCFNVTLLSCGAESNGNRGATVPNTNITTLAGDGTTVVSISDVGSDNVGLFRGTSYVITGGQGINLINCASTNAGRPSASNGTTVNSRDILVRGNARNVFIGSPRTSVTSGNIFAGRFNISFEGFNGEFPKGQVMYNPATDGSVTPAVANQYISNVNNDANAAPVLIQPGSDVLVMSDNKIHTPITANQITSVEGLVGNASTATKLQNNRSLSFNGDVSGSNTFDGSANTNFSLSLSNTGVIADSYKMVTVDPKGRITGGSNPTTLGGFGITDAMSTNHIANGITSTQINNWTNAYSFANNFTTNNPDLAAIEALAGTDGYLRKDGNGQWSLTQASYTLPVASSSVFGGVRLISDAVQTVAVDSLYSAGKRTYGVQMNSSKQMVVNVPWVDTNTTYSNGEGINLTGTQFSANFGTVAGTIAQGNDPRIVNAIKLNTEFTINTNSGLILSDNYFGSESGIIDTQQGRSLATKIKEYYFYGSKHSGFEGLNFNSKRELFGMGREANYNDKLTVEGSVKASQNFKSEEERPDTLFIPNGNTATLRDEIVNDESDYAIRLDPHEYLIDSYSFLEVDDRNRIIHIIGEYTKMAVDFRNIYPKQHIVIYNFDNDGSMEVKIYGKTIYNIEPRCFLRLYVTKSLRVIAERPQPCDVVL
ncbi:hypothetical protein ASG22_16130 [Chryseobacterium sp. Leaf405]|uniref:right-handed parallel beta-helix repeat-containing protein n=1 Tax=Chryseobacterium sp. Leaf405 TaxID=1736367 RepID=UPI0006F46939|nr:right-handed parallel beta-helix repeat-containing protein [Chryseobacterium sp. Leaf405]KQT20946.1 hypothetical protein ASG22_16130 [Chryseobacterium sp. Leaf405]